MITQSIVYHEFMETLKSQAVKTENLAFRDKIRKTMLGYSLRILNFTSVWMSYYDEQKKQFVVVNSSRKLINSRESMTVNRERYSRDISNYLTSQFQAAPSKPFTFHTKNLKSDDVIYEIYGQYEASVLFMKFYSNDSLWGMVEMWDSLQPGRIIGEDEEKFMRTFIEQLSATLLTEEG